MDRADLIGGVAIAAIGLLMIFVIIPATTVKGMYFGLAPTFFPTLLTACITICAGGLAAQSLYRMRKRSSPRRVPVTRWKLLMFLVAAAIAVGAVIVIDRFGILIGGPILIAAFMVFLGERNPLRILLTATLPVGFIYFLALHVLGTPVP